MLYWTWHKFPLRGLVTGLFLLLPPAPQRTLGAGGGGTSPKT